VNEEQMTDQVDTRNQSSTLDTLRRWNVLAMAATIAALIGCAPAASSTRPATTAASAGEEGPRSDANCPREDMFGPVFLDSRQYQARTGNDAKSFATLVTTKEKPLEECGIPPVLEKLAWLRCNDGSNPFDGKSRAAHASRRGSIGPGGRCDSIIDVYVVPCPEAQYEVFADSYVCEKQ
jgi:hypothetical protein